MNSNVPVRKDPACMVATYVDQCDMGRNVENAGRVAGYAFAANIGVFFTFFPFL